MSAAEAPGVAFEATRSRRRDVRPFFWCFTVTWASLTTYLIFVESDKLVHDLRAMAGWVVLDAIVNLLPLRGWQSAPFAADDPVVLAVALIFRPVEAALIILLGAADPRELRRGTTLSKSLANRAQLSFCWFMGSFAAHTLASDPRSSSLLLPLALLTMAIAWILNYSFVAFSISLDRGSRMSHVVRQLKIGASRDFLITFLAWCVLGAMIVTLYDRVGNWALVAFLGPILLGRQALERSQESIDARAAYRSREVALLEITRQVDQERADERRLIAADLHDEVLQPLFKVTLMSQVVRDELLRQRFIEADDDLLDLKEAADLATDTLRALVGDLRRPGLGRGGIAAALTRLAELAREQTSSTVHAQLDVVDMESLAQLAFYQIGKEAVTNALHHAQAKNVWIELRSDQSTAILEVRDDGTGFDPSVERPSHYGLHIMRERAAAVNASFFLDTSPGRGCVIRTIVRLPTPET